MAPVARPRAGVARVTSQILPAHETGELELTHRSVRHVGHVSRLAVGCRIDKSSSTIDSYDLPARAPHAAHPQPNQPATDDDLLAGDKRAFRDAAAIGPRKAPPRNGCRWTWKRSSPSTSSTLSPTGTAAALTNGTPRFPWTGRASYVTINIAVTYCVIAL